MNAAAQSAGHTRVLKIVGLLWVLTELLHGHAGAADEDFPADVRGRTAAQMEELFREAARQEQIPVELAITVRNRVPYFDCCFAPNTNGRSWYALLNAQRGKLQQQDRDYKAQNMERAIEQRVTIRGRTYFTVVWKQKQDPLPALRLPDGELPQAGATRPAFAGLDRFFCEFLREHNASGVTVAVARDGQLVYARAFGYADVEQRQPMQPDTMLRIASLSKPLTAIAVLRMVELGQLRLDDRVLPLLHRGGYRLTDDSDERWQQITVRHLLQHAGGWDRDQSGDPMFKVVEVTRAFELPQPARQVDILRYQLQQPLDFDPGAKYAYSNFGYSVLGRVMEIVSGQDYERLMRSLVLEPAGMSRTRLGRTKWADRQDGEARYHPQQGKRHTPFWLSVPRKAVRRDTDDFTLVEEPYGRWDLEVMDAHGGWISTAPDLVRLLSRTDASREALLTEASRRTMLQAPDYADPGRSVWYGLGWQVRQKRTPRPDRPIYADHNIWHSGALAGTSTLLVRRSDGMSWAVLFNTDRSSQGQRLSTLMDSQMHFAVNSVAEWPEVDDPGGAQR